MLQMKGKDVTEYYKGNKKAEILTKSKTLIDLT